MTNRSEDEAMLACEVEILAETEARLLYRDALEALATAQANLEAERSAWDESSYGTGAGFLGLVAGFLSCIAPDPTFITKGVCVAGIAGGALSVAGSEIDREREIEAAEAAVAAAQDQVDRALQNVVQAEQAVVACMNHQQMKVAPL